MLQIHVHIKRDCFHARYVIIEQQQFGVLFKTNGIEFVS